ncbi:uncharacterized protein BT62DRAFT_577810 [Guyanagaster necrorhizus]|uniref:Uncharacterized protein n=1 Tax=Guyanagaster necrorhizus TaxID=856835 RepID=A0A9P8ALU5_9AGAR|nr:uncharacterized protein BT62DRAFT_577810 [Guyanagaster necrorhizus MCA 3950]KAG7440598.1 hypothetical protein BT62DRAFT_577810 [Guyanagaster necrorhizus MCA 3950]
MSLKLYQRSILVFCESRCPDRTLSDHRNLHIIPISPYSPSLLPAISSDSCQCLFGVLDQLYGNSMSILAISPRLSSTLRPPRFAAVPSHDHLARSQDALTKFKSDDEDYSCKGGRYSVRFAIYVVLAEVLTFSGNPVSLVDVIIKFDIPARSKDYIPGAQAVRLKSF